jgi:hypothetical protein
MSSFHSTDGHLYSIPKDRCIDVISELSQMQPGDWSLVQANMFTTEFRGVGRRARVQGRARSGEAGPLRARTTFATHRYERAARILNHMTAQEAEDVSITEYDRGTYFRVDRAQGNYSRAENWQHGGSSSASNCRTRMSLASFGPRQRIPWQWADVPRNIALSSSRTLGHT